MTAGYIEMYPPIQIHPPIASGQRKRDEANILAFDTYTGTSYHSCVKGLKKSIELQTIDL